MKTALTIVMLAPILAACSSTGSFATAKQRELEQHHVSCSLATATPAECTQRAMALCGVDGYEVVDTKGTPVSITDANSRIRCKVQSGKAPLGS